MKRTTSSAQNFFARAEREANRYGDDPWVFLRELVQNSRDAGATDIEFHASRRGGMEILTCCDNGEGMTEPEFRAYFLRLYASSKEEDPGSIGYFGVGFWSTLLFVPEKIRVTSCRGGKTLAFEIDPGQTAIRPVAPEPLNTGTRIELFRSASLADEAAFAATMRERLIYYVGFVRPQKQATDLRLFCNGVQINGSFPVPKQWGQAFKTRAFDGVIGFGKMPYVRIYKGGILVRDLVSLSEVIPSRKSHLPDNGWSLHPTIQINIDGLQVLMDRRKIFEDPLLFKAVDYCEQQLLRQHKRLVGQLFPMNFRNRILRLASRFAWRPALATLLLVVAGFLAAYLLHERLSNTGPNRAAAGPYHPGAAPPDPRRSRAPESERLDEALRNWNGSVIDYRNSNGVRWAFNYEGPNLLFRIRTFAAFDPIQGLGPEDHRQMGSYPQLPRAPGPGAKISMGLSGTKQWTCLPLPSGYAVDADKVRAADGRKLGLSLNQFGEPVIRATRPLTINYEIFPCDMPPEGLVTEAPEVIDWPADFRHQIDRVRGWDPNRAAQTLTAFVARNFTYTRDSAAADSFNRDTRPWIEKLIAARSGDCDVLNGLLALMLRSAGIRAYLCVGLVGFEGQVKSDFHAWTRYYDGRWQDVDVSGLALRQGRTALADSNDPAAADLEGQQPDSASGPAVASGAASLSSPSAAPFRYSWPWLLLVPLAFGIWRLKRGWQRPIVERSRYVIDLFQHYFAQGRADDRFGLQFRPVFPLLSGRHISLFELQDQADRGPLLGAASACKLTPLLPRNQPVLDRSADIVTALLPFLPSVTWLDEVETIATPAPKPWPLTAIEATVRKLDPDFRLHLLAGSADISEICLALKDRSLGKRHLLVGDRHPLFRELAAHNPADEASHFNALRLLLARTTFYLGESDDFLMGLAAGHSAGTL